MSNLSQRRFGRIATLTLSVLLAFSLVGGGLLVGSVAAAGDVTITVNDQTGEAVEGATVTLVNSTDDSEVASNTTDASGNVTFSAVSDGEYYTEVSVDGYANLEGQTITVSGSAVTASESVNDEIVNEKVSVVNDTRTAYVELEGNMTDGNTSDVTVTFSGIDSDGNYTTVATETVTVSGNQTSLSSAAINDSEAQKYDKVEIYAEGDASKVNGGETGTTVAVAGGGGFSAGSLFSYSVAGIPVIFLLVGAGGVALYMREQ